MMPVFRNALTALVNAEIKKMEQHEIPVIEGELLEHVPPDETENE